MPLFKVAVLGLASLLSGCAMLRDATEPDFDVLNFPWPTPAPVAWRTPQPRDYTLPQTPKPILVVADRLAENLEGEITYPSVMAALMRHFTPDAHWVFANDLTANEVDAAQAVVYIGDNEHFTVPSRTIELLRGARRLMWMGHHLDQVRRSALAFDRIEPAGHQFTTDGPGTLRYGRATYPIEGTAHYARVRVRGPAKVLASTQYGSTTIPLLVEDSGNYYVSSFDSLDSSQTTVGRITMLAVADVLNDVVGVAADQDVHAAILCLEGATANTPPGHLAAVVAALYREGIPYGLGFTPQAGAVGLKPGRVRESPYLVRVLRWAREHGATLVLHTPLQHGPSHSDRLPETQGEDQSGPAAGVESYAALTIELLNAHTLIEDVLDHEDKEGLRPLIWETPFGGAGMADDVIAGNFFGTTWQRRAPIAWLPWIVQSDADGQLVLPAYIDGIQENGPPDLRLQLDAARTLRMCRGCVAASFLPVSLSPESVERYIAAMRGMGYVFVNPGAFARPPGNTVDAYELRLQTPIAKDVVEARLR